MIQIVISFFVAHFFHAMLNGSTTGTGSQVQLNLIQTDGFRGHDFVVFTVFQHAVLMDPGGVCEGVRADNGFVARDRHVGYLADNLAGAVDFFVINVGVNVHVVAAGADRHDHFFQRSVTGAFTDTVQCAFNLARTGLYRGDGVTDSHAQIIVAVNGNNRFINVWNTLIQIGDDST